MKRVGKLQRQKATTVQQTRNGTETQRTLDYAGRPDYREAFEKETQEIRDMEIWRAGKAVRSLRPENQ